MDGLTILYITMIVIALSVIVWIKYNDYKESHQYHGKSH